MTDESKGVSPESTITLTSKMTGVSSRTYEQISKELLKVRISHFVENSASWRTQRQLVREWMEKLLTLMSKPVVFRQEIEDLMDDVEEHFPVDEEYRASGTGNDEQSVTDFFQKEIAKRRFQPYNIPVAEMSGTEETEGKDRRIKTAFDLLEKLFGDEQPSSFSVQVNRRKVTISVPQEVELTPLLDFLTNVPKSIELTDDFSVISFEI